METTRTTQSQEQAEFRILLVDDDGAFRDVMSQHFAYMNLKLECVTNASEFLICLAKAETPYDLAIIDINLPDLSGDQIISWLSASELNSVRTLPILIVTGIPQAHSRDIVTNGAAFSYLQKPFRFKTLEDTVVGLLTRGTKH